MEEIAISKLKKSIKHQNKDILYINISFPVIKNKEHEKINLFYKSISDEFLKYCESKLKNIATACAEKNAMENPHGASLNSVISYQGNGIVSVILDFSYYDGNLERKVRKSQNWLLESGCPVFSKDIFKHPQKVKSRVLNKAKEFFRSKEAEHLELHPKCISLASRHFSYENFYFTNKGIAYFFQPGILSDSKNNAVVFVFGYDEFGNLFKNKYKFSEINPMVSKV